MRPSPISILSALSATITIASAQWPIPVPWEISALSVQNERHGTGGWWQFAISDNLTATPQGFETQTCYYYGNTAAYFAVDDYPVDQPCNANFTELTFTFAPSPRGFDLNITHCWGPSGEGNDYGTWSFSKDDVVGQESDVANNFGQAGSFESSGFSMYPVRSTPSTEIWE